MTVKWLQPLLLFGQSTSVSIDRRLDKCPLQTYWHSTKKKRGQQVWRGSKKDIRNLTWEINGLCFHIRQEAGLQLIQFR